MGGRGGKEEWPPANAAAIARDRESGTETAMCDVEDASQKNPLIWAFASCIALQKSDQHPTGNSPQALKND